jgi:transcriptional regulator GlxA family with amidase domain
VIVAYERVQLLDVAGPADVLDVATKVLAVPADKRHSGSLDVALAADFSSGSEGYTCLVATPDGRSVRTSSGLMLGADMSLADVVDLDTLIVAGALDVIAPLSDDRLIRELPRLAATREWSARSAMGIVERVRVEAAREVLENTPAPLEAVATRCGFASVETMRRAFKRVIGIGPGEYRERSDPRNGLPYRARLPELPVSILTNIAILAK